MHRINLKKAQNQTFITDFLKKKRLTQQNIAQLASYLLKQREISKCEDNKTKSKEKNKNANNF